MKHILKADFKKFLSSKIPIVLLLIAVLLPLLNSGFTWFIIKVMSNEDSAGLGELFNNLYVYAGSFSPSNNVGLILLILVIIVGANDFTQATIRNKIIAGHSKNNIYLSSLIVNLTIMLVTMFTYSTLSYLFNGIFMGFNKGELNSILKFAAIGFSGLVVLYSLITVFLYKFKKMTGTIFSVLGVVLGLLAINGLLTLIPKDIIDFSFFQHIFPIIRVNVVFVVNVDLWWLALLVNAIYTALLLYLGLRISNKTDYN